MQVGRRHGQVQEVVETPECVKQTVIWQKAGLKQELQPNDLKDSEATESNDSWKQEVRFKIKVLTKN